MKRIYRRRHSLAVVLLIVAVESRQAIGCGPDFPNWLLAAGDRAVLVAPEGNFAAELARMKLGDPRVHAIPPETPGDYSAQSIDAELDDLLRALKQAGIPPSQARIICDGHRLQRKLVADAVESRGTWKVLHPGNAIEPSEAIAEAGDKPPAFPNATVTTGLPAEFADYFEGLILWQNPAVREKQAARAKWERLLAMPEAERKYKSTWAAFMLGKSWEKADPSKAVAYFKQVRALAQQGYRDSVGLAAASLGLEAKVYLQQTNFEGAIETYLDQMASGDPTSTNSLFTAAAKALAAGPEALRALAKNPRAQKVITAYVISRPTWSSIYGSASWQRQQQPTTGDSMAAAWLQATEEAEIKDMDSAEALALAAYRADNMDMAARWINRAPGSALAQWLQAKLLLRAGKLQGAAALLARISPQFPIVHEGTNSPPPVERKDTLSVNCDAYSPWHASAERQVHAELGVLLLSRGEYVEALDSLLNAGFWMDAAYIAERVLTVEELKHYVDRFWPAATADEIAQEKQTYGESEVCPARLREQIRYLLARRLTRELHADQARDYYPAEWVGAFDQLMTALNVGWDQTLQSTNRAAALFQASLITRTNGMELIGTEVAPDWHYHLGQYDEGVTAENRRSNSAAILVRPSEDELRRSAEHRPDPDLRFHYRNQAAALAWQSASLSPDNSDETAYILWRGGSFLKNTDPGTADIFYKALVRRNRKTVLGAEADKQRWFPIIDENGKIVPKRSRWEAPRNPSEEHQINESDPTEDPAIIPPIRESEERQDSQMEKGYEYEVNPGDSLIGNVRSYNQAGVAVTLDHVLAANPGLDPSKLQVGQRIFVPVGDQ